VTRAALLLAISCALGATLAAALHANPGVIGWLAALACLAIAAAAGALAKSLNAPDDLSEDRHPRGPSAPDPLEVRNPLSGPSVINRSRMFGTIWGYALGAFGILALVPFVALARRAAPRGTAWSRGARLVDADGAAIKANDIPVGGVTTVFPEGHVAAAESATLLIRLEDGLLLSEPGREGWAPGGNVAYSKICTHAGCPVAVYNHLYYQLYCPCHQSVFDVLQGAKPLSGPATRALPQLALDIDGQGYLVARGDYTEPVGPDRWSRPS
jgi:ubiquinol-cytochrome c reductase iron-sulfur subunit